VDLLGWAGRPGDAERLAEGLLAEGPLDPNVEATVLIGIRLSLALNGSRISHLPLPPARVLEDASVPAPLRIALRAMDAFGRRFDDLDRADRETTAALIDAERIGQDFEIMMTQQIRSAVLYARGELGASVRHAEAAVAAADAGSLLAKRGVPRGPLGYVLFAADRFDDALDALGRALLDAQRYGPQFTAGIEAFRALLFLSAGRIDDAATEAASSATSAEDAGMPHPVGGVPRVQGEVAFRRGDLAAAHIAAEQLMSLCRCGPDWAQRRVGCRRSGRCGRPPGARAGCARRVHPDT
jgi:hypothetical protein